MIRLRRLLIIGILTFALVSACRGNAPQQTSSRTGSTSANAKAVRVVNHAMGKTEVPINPKRVVVLTDGLDTVLSLGVKPVGSIQISLNDYYLENRLEGIENIGGRRQPSFEAIAALNPDLILGTESDNKKNYELLSQIAPTILAKAEINNNWQEMLNQYAQALGKTDQAEQIIKDYQVRINKFQAQMGDRLNETEVSIARIRQNEIEIYREDSFCGTIVADAGLPRPPAQANADNQNLFKLMIGKESLNKADGDVIFIWTYGDNQGIAGEAQKALRQLNADPLWSKLNAVQQGNVYDVPSYWIGVGPIAANLVLDDLFEYLIDRPNEESKS